MEFNVADSQDNVNALGIAHWIFLPPTVNALKNLYQMRKEIRPSELI